MHSLITMLLAALVLSSLAVGAARGAEAPAIPPGGEPVVDAAGMSGFRLSGEGAAVEIIQVEGQPFGRAVRVRTVKEPQQWWFVQLLAPSTAPVKDGDVLLCTFYARGTETVDESGKPQGMVYFQGAASPWHKSLSRRFTTGAEWRRYDLPFEARQDLAPGRAVLGFGLGFKPQTVEISGVSVLNFGQDLIVSDLPTTSYRYDGDEPDAPWRAAAARRIEQHRKADLTLRVTDAGGRAVEGAEVSVSLQRHAFGFGSAISSTFIQFERQDLENLERYKAKIVELFNTVAIENHLKWRGWTEWRGRDRALDTLRWLKENGISARGHVLVWPNWNHAPRAVQERFENDPEGLRQAIAEHITEITRATRGLLYEWDVMNEPTTNHQFMDVLGEEAMVEWFRLASEADPEVRLMVNEYNILAGGHSDNLERVARFLLDRGAPVGSIGIQSHMGMEPVGIPKVLTALDRMAQFGLPLVISEFDQPTSDELLQGRYMRDFMTAVFSHPAVDSFIMWGFWEGRHWRPEAALFRDDWSVKPNGRAYVDLVLGQWRTEETGRTDARGSHRTRGFLGDYIVTVRHEGRALTRSVALGREGVTETFTLE